jgi:DNA-binding LacI/PurR family transcriptional regulator
MDARQSLREEMAASRRASRAVPTIREVARRAGVSIATVSRALNQAADTAPETVARVRAAAEALGFRPNLVGRRLKLARSHTIGVLVPSLSNPVFADAVAGIERAADAAGYAVILCASDYDAVLERRAIDTLLAQRVDGLVLTVADADANAALDLLDAEAVRYVLLYNQPRRRAATAVSVDNVAAAHAATAALVAAGHRRLAMVAGDVSASDRSRLRHEGFRAAIAEAGLAPGRLIEVPFAATDLGPAFAALFRAPDRPTGLFCSTDMLAIAALRALHDLGLAVPRDVAVVGFDGIAVGELVLPSLATIVQPNAALGACAFAALRAALDGTQAPEATLLPHRLRHGESLAMPPTPSPRTQGGNE